MASRRELLNSQRAFYLALTLSACQPHEPASTGTSQRLVAQKGALNESSAYPVAGDSTNRSRVKESFTADSGEGGFDEANPLLRRENLQLRMSRGIPAGSQAQWCAFGGAPLVGEPVLDKKERVYAATADGYLHAFERDGRYRFSYTVKGTPLGSVSLRSSDGVILIGTTARYVYAINQNGSLHWSFRTVSPVWSGLFALNAQAVTFMGLDQRLYALSNSGGALYRVHAPGVPTTEPVVGKDDVVWLGLEGGVARFHAAFSLEKLPLPGVGPVEQIVTWGKGAVARAGGRLFWLRLKGTPQELASGEQMGSDGSLLAVNEQRQIKIYQLPHDQQQPAGKRHELSMAEAAVSAAITIDHERLWLAHEDGTMTIDALNSKRVNDEVRLQVSDKALGRVIVGASGSFFVVADREGLFCAGELPTGRGI